MLGIILVLFLAFLAYWFLIGQKEAKDFPPCPKFRLPLLGNVLDMGSLSPKGFHKLSQKYGGIFGLYLFVDRAVIVSDFELMREMGNIEDLGNKVHLPMIAELRGGLVKSGAKMTTPGITFGSGPNWAEQRKFSLRTLKSLGLGKKSMESLITEEIAEFCNWIDSFQGEPVDIRTGFTMAAMNSLWTIVTSSRISGYDDPELMEMIRLINLFAVEIVKPKVFPFFKYKTLFEIAKTLDLNLFESHKAIKAVYGKMNAIVNEHENTYDEDNLRDLIDHYLKDRYHSSESKNASLHGHAGKLNLLGTLLDLFAAGGGTTGLTLYWGMLFLLLHPEIKQKVVEELDGVTERSRLPTLEDRPKTPFTEATIHEIQRLATIIPLAASTAGEASKLGDYFIPKGTLMFRNYYHVHTNPNTFKEPLEFNPSRFINDKGEFEQHEQVIPFGLGVRRCIGEHLARKSVYLFFTGILSTFDLAKADADQVLTTERSEGVVVSPMPFKMRFILRE